MSKRQIAVLAYNIRSLWNVGSFFRTSDCFGAEKIELSGYTAQPPRREISKTALGAEEWIPWSYTEDPLKVVEAYRKQGYSIVSLEEVADSIDITVYEAPEKLLLIVGNEVLGVPDMLLGASDAVIHIPMVGKKESLNVSTAFGIALHRLQLA